ncbi:hypothetical protein [Streptomyces sp. WM6378]|uniref:hypothetical protein n=1 Tax=Streptomyces sp. WM6378 TaxID=1415557 RepID=UPI0006AF9C93|nr:hypothetical protein [Streptomyces sp. WM6378]KOU37571.1 hypothetical protein ADK54_31620 [Streptomyces sp. WM6378]
MAPGAPQRGRPTARGGDAQGRGELRDLPAPAPAVSLRTRLAPLTNRDVLGATGGDQSRLTLLLSLNSTALYLGIVAAGVTGGAAIATLGDR